MLYVMCSYVYNFNYEMPRYNFYFSIMIVGALKQNLKALDNDYKLFFPSG